LAISIPGIEAAVIWHFQERMPYGAGTQRGRGLAQRRSRDNSDSGRVRAFRLARPDPRLVTIFKELRFVFFSECAGAMKKIAKGAINTGE
jgi:hypothetical protein